MTDQVKEITDKLPDYHWVYGPGVDLNASVNDATGCLQNRRRQFGNLVLSKFPILASRNHLLPKMSFHAQLSIQRSMLDCVIAGQEATYGSHLCIWRTLLHRNVSSKSITYANSRPRPAMMEACSRASMRTGGKMTCFRPGHTPPFCWETSTCLRMRRPIPGWRGQWIPSTDGSRKQTDILMLGFSAVAIRMPDIRNSKIQETGGSTIALSAQTLPIVCSRLGSTRLRRGQIINRYGSRWIFSRSEIGRV